MQCLLPRPSSHLDGLAPQPPQAVNTDEQNANRARQAGLRRSVTASLSSGKVCTTVVLILAFTGASTAQVPVRPADEALQVADRIRGLYREAARLAGESRTLMGELRKLEVERTLRVEEAKLAEAAAEAARQDLMHIEARLDELEQERLNQLPDLERQVVDLYKRGRAGNIRLLLGSGSFRQFARARRAVAMLTSLSERRLAEHRRTLESFRQQHATLEDSARALQTQEAEAKRAREASERAVGARRALLARIDAERDLHAQYLGELEAVYASLQQEMAALQNTPAAGATATPLLHLRHMLDWPVEGTMTAAFGQSQGRLGGTASRNGIEIAAPEGTPVRAILDGRVRYADAFAGLGTLVILDHGGNNYSLYGYLESASVSTDDEVQAGTEIGHVGSAPAGPPTLYFELRIDGGSVDPLQWLESR
jgi:murein hydrolase activator